MTRLLWNDHVVHGESREVGEAQPQCAHPSAFWTVVGKRKTLKSDEPRV